MQWNGDTDAGFSVSKTPWLPVAPNYPTVNVSAESRDPNSLLNYYKKLIRLRRENEQFKRGDFITVDNSNDNVLSYLRKTPDGKAVLVSMNFTAAPQTVKLDLTPDVVKGQHGKLILASYANASGVTDLKNLLLPPYGSYVAEVVP
jgi:alpha-glucosidase